MAFSAPAFAQNTPAIEWQLENPFRYFKKPADTAKHRRALLALKEDEKSEPVLGIERQLATQDGKRGWASGVFEHVMDEACWYSHPKEGEAPGKASCGDYIKPKSHAVQLSAPSVAGACTWSVAGQTIASADCRKPSKPVQVPYGVKSEVTLSVAGKAGIAKDVIEVEDILVVGMGDSFGAGEGNPDRPVAFVSGATIDYDVAAGMTGYPQRVKLKNGETFGSQKFVNSGAGWVHRTCHRSLYSHQLRLALQLAIEHPQQHRSVTFVGLACTGASVLDMFKVYGGREELPATNDLAHSSRKHQLSQLSILSHVLCEPNEAEVDTAVNYNAGQRLELPNKGKEPVIDIFTCKSGKRLRNVDLLLLSVGGNDVGFSKLVANASLSEKELTLPDWFGEYPAIDPDTARAYLARLPKRYEALSEALTAAMGTGSSRRVLLTAYPRMGFSEDGKPCPSGAKGMDVTKVWTLDDDAIAEVEDFIEKDLTKTMREAAKAAGWLFSDTHRAEKKFAARGICSSNDAEKNSAERNNEKFPRHGFAQDPSKWSPYAPYDFLPYRSRQRWFRTPNDAFLTVHYHQKTPHLPDLKVTQWSGYSGAFHPNAEGQAALADSILNDARKILAAGPPK